MLGERDARLQHQGLDVKELPRSLSSDQVSAVMRALTCRDLHLLLDHRERDLVQEIGETVTSPDTTFDSLKELIDEARDEVRSIRYCRQYLARLGEAVAISPSGGRDA